MANPERQGKRLGQQSQGNTARTQDPTSSYGLQKEPMDHVRPQTEKLPQQTRAERIRAAEDDALRPNQGAAEPITQGSSPQRNDPTSPDSSQGTRAAANEQQRIESERPPRNGSPAATNGSRK